MSVSVDTTVDALGNTLWCLATFKDQWEKLRHNHSLLCNAFEEGLRYEGPGLVFFRTTVRDTTIGGLPIGRNQKAAALMASANRDPRRWPHPDTFDIERRAAGHMALGTGIHGCAGQTGEARHETTGRRHRAVGPASSGLIKQLLEAAVSKVPQERR